MKKFLLLLFVVTTCFACRDNDAGISPSNGEKGKFGFVPREMGLAIEYYQSVLNSFRGSRSSDAGGALTAKEYPENYGGAYINDQNKLVILVPTSQLATRTKYRDILGHTNFIIEPCEFSYRQLLEVRDSLVEAVFTNPKYPEVKENVVSIAVKDKENEIEVGLLDCSEARISEFKGKILDSPVVCFRETGVFTMDRIKELIPGEKVSTDRAIESGNKGSLEYGAKNVAETGWRGEKAACYVVKDTAEARFSMGIPRSTYCNTDTIVLTLRNHTDKNVSIGEDYEIKYFDGTNWISPFKFGFYDAAYPLSAKGIYRIYITLGEEFKPGKYRIIKKIDGVLLTCDFKVLPPR